MNGRGLDIRVRLPGGHEGLEPAVREAIGKAVTRGNVTVALTLANRDGGGEVRVNERALAIVLDAVDRLAKRDRFAKARPEGILALRGVLEVSEAPPDGDALSAPLLAALGRALDGLVVAREAEGRRLAPVLAGLVDAIDRLTREIAALPSRRPEAVRQRLAEQIQRLAGATSALDPERLHQEAMLLASRGDVEEEIKRLTAHVEAARGLLADRAPAGRRLDFLTQEFNREANTICSKSGDIDMTRLGLELKAVIDQLREQIQNIE